MNERALHTAAQWSHPWVGFYAPEFTGRPYEESDYVDPSWAPADLESIVRYLREAPVALATSGQGGPCGRCGAWIESGAYRFDGTWLWPDPFAHLVERHGFVVPDRMVHDIRARHYQPPPWDPAWADRLPFPQPTDH